MLGYCRWYQFHQFSAISTNFQTNFTYFMGYQQAWWYDSKKIYILGSNPDFRFAHLNRAKLWEAGRGGIHKVTYMTDHKSLFIFRKTSHDNTLSPPLLSAIAPFKSPLFWKHNSNPPPHKVFLPKKASHPFKKGGCRCIYPKSIHFSSPVNWRKFLFLPPL